MSDYFGKDIYYEMAFYMSDRIVPQFLSTITGNGKSTVGNYAARGRMEWSRSFFRNGAAINAKW